MIKRASSSGYGRGKFFSISFNSHIVDSSWILDTVATRHICHSLDWYKTYNIIEVRLPNGSSVAATCIGKILLNSDLIIENVLFVPEFVVNLPSVFQLCSEQKCLLTFEPEYFTIQAKKDLRMIGLAKQLEGIYYLEANQRKIGFVSSLVAFNDLNKNDASSAILRHLRLEHLSHDRMPCFHKQ